MNGLLQRFTTCAVYWRLPPPLALIAATCFVCAIGFAPSVSQAQHGTPAHAPSNPFSHLGLPEIAITISDDEFFGLPRELPAGRYVLSVTNEYLASQEETSGAAFIRLPDDVSVASFIADVSDPESESWPRTWYNDTELAGGPYAVLGESASAVIDLDAGVWMLWSEAPGAPQTPAEVNVIGVAPTDPPTPAADVTIEMTEFAFTMSSPLTAGRQILEVVNSGDQPHFVFIGGVPDETTAEDALAAFEAYWSPETAPPGAFSFAESPELLGTGDQSAGSRAWYSVDLPPGTIVMSCFVADPETGLPHAMLGMVDIMVIA